MATPARNALHRAPRARAAIQESWSGELFATRIAVALARAPQSRQLNDALATRDTIGQAEGILVQRENVDSTPAFSLLVRASQQANIKLAAVAARLVYEHERPGHAPRPVSSS